MVKKIHYCWFGGNPHPKLLTQCLNSWKKYLPDFEIIEWNEDNFDVKGCDFSKQAYENKKWAFVSDYCRMKVLKEYGGIYLDTDMEITKDISNLLENEVFLGVEDSGYIAAGVIWAKNPNNKFISEVLDFYETNFDFDVNNLFDFSIPKVITNILDKYDKKEKNGIEIIDDNVYVYPADYFYPINYDYSKKIFTNNTCMVHYYNACWVPTGEKIHIWLNRRIGVSTTNILFSIFRVIKWPFNFVKRLFNKLNYKTRNIRYKVNLGCKHLFKMSKRLKKIDEDILSCKDYNYISISNPNWMGVSNSTKDLFKSWIGIEDTYFKKEPYEIAKRLCSSGKKMLIFSGMAKGYEKIIENINEINKDIKVKVFWHGSNALLTEYTDYICFMNVINLYKTGKIHEIGFAKKSLYEFYKEKGFNVSFVANIITIKNANKYVKKKSLNKNNESNDVKIGIYASLGRWVKNTYNQISAASLFKEAKADITPINYEVKVFADTLDLDTSLSSYNSVSREKLFSKMASNNVNTYVSFTECSPLIPLESLELGVPCITGDNHHYFENTKLEEYLVVTKEDNILAIYEKMKLAMENKNEIIKLYKEWKKEYAKEVIKLRDNFLKI